MNYSEALDVVLVAIANMSAEDRLRTFSDIMYGYCEYCGGIDPDGHCQCWNDE